MGVAFWDWGQKFRIKSISEYLFIIEHILKVCVFTDGIFKFILKSCKSCQNRKSSNEICTFRFIFQMRMLGFRECAVVYLESKYANKTNFKKKMKKIFSCKFPELNQPVCLFFTEIYVQSIVIYRTTIFSKTQATHTIKFKRFFAKANCHVVDWS